MQVDVFRRTFWDRFNAIERKTPDDSLWDKAVADKLDLCPDVPGMLSLRKQQLLNLAYGLLPPEECYVEVGTFRGKSLLSAMLGNPERSVFAADNFSEFEENSLQETLGNLDRYGLRDKVTFYDTDFRNIYDRDHLPVPIGLYFYDGAHDEASQFDAIRLVEPYLADEALVLVDDWRYAPDSLSHAKSGTLRATAISTNRWRLLYELPARANGDLGLWWNGVGVLAFRRNSPSLA